MNGDLDVQSNGTVIDQSLEEIHRLLCILEEQIKLGLIPTQLEIETAAIETVEMVIPEGKLLQSENC